MVAHTAIAAVPVAGTPDRGLLQADLIQRYPYVIFDAEDPEALDPTNSSEGTVAQALAYLGRLFFYDPDDSTTAHDGTTCLVTAGGERYKLTDTDALIFDVLDKDLTAPPGSPTVGDRYIVGAAATGDWAGHDDELTQYTARGWVFTTPGTGFVVYVADENEHYKYVSGSWTVAFSLTALSVLPTHIVGGKINWIVENQTTNTPPSSPQGTAYIIGSSPTGAWVGHTGKIAFKESTGTGTDYVIYTPAEGWAAYDKALNIPLRYDDSGAWVSDAGAIVAFSYVFTESGSESTNTGGAAPSYNASTPPTNASYYVQDDAGLTHTAKKTGALLRFRWQGHCDIAADRVIGLFRDSETNAIDWAEISDTPGAHRAVEFIVAAPDTSAHTYKIQIKDYLAAPLTRRTFTIEEMA